MSSEPKLTFDEILDRLEKNTELMEAHMNDPDGEESPTRGGADIAYKENLGLFKLLKSGDVLYEK
jgi:hypothetical protein